ncbi:MAG: hypothetical protein EAZ36_01035 [Verrucomicrobia bacterium]|nr:MAG: hypothetical protein EAZ36_01035 [Verrucomicrobiota bacterium]
MNARPLNDEQKLRLRALGKPLATNWEIAEGGLTPEFYGKVQAAFKHSELLKVRLLGAHRPTRASLIAHIVKHGDCQLVATEGSVALFVRNRTA